MSFASRPIRALPFLAPLLLGSGCTLLPVGGSPSGSPGGCPALGGRLQEIRTVFHCHSHLSHDSEGTIEEIARAARDLGIQVVLLTDHYEPGNVAASPRGLVDGVLFVPGVELHGREGSLMVVGPREDFDPHLPRAELVAQLERQGAFLAAGHVEEMPESLDASPYGGFEVYNLHAEFEAADGWSIAGRFLFYTPDAFFEAAITPPRANLELWDRLLLAGHHLAPLAGQDAHAKIHVFGPLGGTVGTYPELFRLFSTRILAEEVSESAVLEALHRGRTYVIFDYLSDEGGLTFRYGAAGTPDEQFATLGDCVPHAPGGQLEVQIPESARLRLIRNGTVLREEDGRELVVQPPGAGIYRVEAWRGDRLWIVSAPIYLTDPDS